MTLKILQQKVEEIELENTRSIEKPCPICPDEEYCHCGMCEECDYMSTEEGLNMHIMNSHNPKEVYDHFGREWIRAHKHLIRGSLELYNRYWKEYT